VFNLYQISQWSKNKFIGHINEKPYKSLGAAIKMVTSGTHFIPSFLGSAYSLLIALCPTRYHQVPLELTNPLELANPQV
jgi:hypothetical protein